MYFIEKLREQRWDDHRYYHHSRMNQTLHLLSACCFLISYSLVFVSPAMASLIAWLLAMTSRQAGHFFFEPKDYDYANGVSHDYKEAVKIGYNLNRKVILLSIWAVIPLLLYVVPNLFGLIDAHRSSTEYIQHVGELWLILGLVAIVFRIAQLWIAENFLTGIVWFVKIFTDPFHDIALYYRSPLYLLKGERYDPIVSTNHPSG